MYKINETIINLIKGDITKIETDAVVNAANNTLLGGGGVDGAIHRAGGSEILEQCKKIGGCPTGEARITIAGNLPSKYVIHTVGPVYRGGDNREAELLYNTYYNSLELAEEYNLKTIAFPSISTGVYGYPIDKASDIAIKAVTDFIEEKGSIDKVVFVLFSNNDYEIYEEKLNKLINE
ncbi:MAG: O-acetyl-ADP-ribose deacetylase [Clostridiaceae bacterium]|nr:O-acetyl-ADP-ribose deacetylase [Clostridiaceae bacterium]MBW4858610.1 O-acetyl-ADP-ribose deacetylase [Clostridiaceae bacterium]MBW4868069.1 O-acetyl-ADP-ribose deacetylase [Clostridiaceae bacterium]